jgi:pimeloyl-ACP methyl ester carboxylesterase
LAKRGFWAGVGRWTGRIFLGLLGLIVLVIAAGAVWEAMERHHAKEAFKPEGKIVDIGGGRHMHIDCRGTGAPTVVLEAGLDTNGTLAWSAVHDQIAAFTRTCAYDRAGVQWSDDKPGVHDGEGVAKDLHALLTAAGEKGPYVLAGHSLGGPYVMTYTRLYPNEVAGVVFVDASHPDQLKRFKAAGLPGGDGGLPWYVDVITHSTWTGGVRLLLNAAGSDPEGPHMPAKADAESKAFGPQSFPAAMAEAKSLSKTLDDAGELRTLGARPLAVLTATKAPGAKTLAGAGVTAAQYAGIQTIWKKLHVDETSWSTCSVHREVPDSTHYIQLGRPDIVIAATHAVVDSVRGGPGHCPPDLQRYLK